MFVWVYIQILSGTSLTKPNLSTEFSHKMVDRWNANGLYCLIVVPPPSCCVHVRTFSVFCCFLMMENKWIELKTKTPKPKSLLNIHLPDSPLCRHATWYLPDGLSPPQRCPSLVVCIICQNLFHYSIYILVLVVLSDREWALPIDRFAFFQGAASTFDCAPPVFTGISSRYCVTWKDATP